MFAAPPEQSLEWADSGVDGAYRFINRLWRLAQNHLANTGIQIKPELLDEQQLNKEQKQIRLRVHQTLKKVSDDIGRRYTFNTAIAAVMELINDLVKFEDESEVGYNVMREAIEIILLMLQPITPHITNHLWSELGHLGLIADSSWPAYDEKALVKDEIELVVQVNGKLRSKITVAVDADNASIEKVALSDDKVKVSIGESTIRKVIVVPKRLVNIVAN